VAPFEAWKKGTEAFFEAFLVTIRGKPAKLGRGIAGLRHDPWKKALTACGFNS
jgi:hypothetical protein